MRNILFALILTLLCIPAGLSAKAWTLFCKSGPGITLTGFEAVAEIRWSMRFPRPVQAAGQNFENLKPGTCSWPDRAFSTNEYPEIEFSLLGKAPYYEVTSDNRIIMNVSNYCGVRNPKGYLFTIQIENTGKKMFKSNGVITFPLGVGGNTEVPDTKCR